MIIGAVQPLIVAAFSFLIVLAALSDLATLRIPNWISIALLVLFFTFAVLEIGRSISLPLHIIVAVGLFCLGLVPYNFGWFGGGDVKLLAAVALWAGPEGVLPFLFFTTLAGAAFGLLIIIGDRFLGLDGKSNANGRLSAYIPHWLQRKIVPYGLAIGVGALLTIPALIR